MYWMGLARRPVHFTDFYNSRIMSPNWGQKLPPCFLLLMGVWGEPSPANIQKIQKWPSLTPEPYYSPLRHKYQEVSQNSNTRQSYSETMIKWDKNKGNSQLFSKCRKKDHGAPQKIPDTPFFWLKWVTSTSLPGMVYSDYNPPSKIYWAINYRIASAFSIQSKVTPHF